MNRWYVSATSAMLFGAAAVAAPLPEVDGYYHEGVASCATSQCHGKGEVEPDSNVRLTEYRTWSSSDYHSKAYSVLRNDESKAIAAKLGLPNAHTENICLDCHADNVPEDYQGDKFQLSDGVGCEACHGGAEEYLEYHTEKEATHAGNLERGLYPLSDPIQRAQLCLSCHLGAKNKFTTHAIMAAGHPRLAFELDTYTENQPAHYDFDADYKERKRDYAVGYLWLVGQLESAKRQLELIEEFNMPRTVGLGMPEFSIYDCHACHQPMDPIRGRPKDFSADLPTGGLRLMDHSFDLLAVAIDALAKPQSGAYRNAVVGLHKAHMDSAKLPAAIEKLRSELAKFEAALEQKPLNQNTAKAIRKGITGECATGRYADYGTAEQAYLAIEAVSYSVGDRKNLLSSLDATFNTLGKEHNFDSRAFAQACRKIQQALP